MRKEISEKVNKAETFTGAIAEVFDLFCEKIEELENEVKQLKINNENTEKN